MIPKQLAKDLGMYPSYRLTIGAHSRMFSLKRDGTLLPYLWASRVYAEGDDWTLEGCDLPDCGCFDEVPS